MKKTLIIIGIVCIGIFLFLRNCGFSVGNVAIGKQPKFQTEQMVDFVSSNFYKNQYSSDSLVVVNLWATWCEPCIDEMPALNDVKKQFNGRPIKFVSLSVDNDSLKLQKFLDKSTFHFDDITFENLAYRTAIINTLNDKEADSETTSQILPVTYLLKNRKVVKRYDGQITKPELVKSIQEVL